MTALSDGVKAPDIELPTDDGGHFSLGAQNGKPVVVYFYPKNDTSGCTREAIDFSRHKAEFDALGAIVVGVSPDGPGSHDRFKEKHRLAITLAADEDKQVAQAYGVWVEKSMYGRTYMGVERSTFLIGRDGTIARIWRKVKVPSHVEEVLAAARQAAR